MKPILSPVDYEAWNNGYIPPSEHILIDQLAYRGAKVIMSMDHGDKGAVWLVMRDGQRPNRETALQLYKTLCGLMEPELENLAEPLPLEDR